MDIIQNDRFKKVVDDIVFRKRADSKRDLAKKIGYCVQYVCDICYYRRPVTIEIVLTICKVYKEYNPMYILYNTEAMRNERAKNKKTRPTNDIS